MGESKTTSQITHELGTRLPHIRREIILMHHYGLLEPVGVQSTFGEEGRGAYYADLLWTLTQHSLEHDDNIEGCRACNLREVLCLHR